MNAIIVVEGRDDTRRLKEIFPTIDTIETNGSAINEDVLKLIEKAHAYREVIVLTDPDFPGEKIRQTITRRIPTVKHAFITVEEAMPKQKGASLGVEHASEEAIRRALSQVREVVEQDLTEHVTKSFLMRCSLIGGENSSRYREKLSVSLGIGHVNGKQLEKRLNMFGISKERVLTEMETILEELYEQ